MPDPVDSTSPSKVADADPLQGALVESRARWRDLALAATDLVFETDEAGRFVLLAPDDAFGWKTRSLLGMSADSLLVRPAGVEGFNPFEPVFPVNRHRTWLRRADGKAASVMVSARPLQAPDGRLIGARGAVLDVTEFDRREEWLSESLLQRQIVKEITRRMRRAVLPDTVIKIGLEELLDVMGAAGALVILGESLTKETSGTTPLAQTEQKHQVLYRAGEQPPATDGEMAVLALEIASALPTPWNRTEIRFGRQMLVAGIATHFCDPVILLLWHQPERRWLNGDGELAAAFMSALSSVLEHDQVQREVGRYSGADRLTALLNREGFVTEVSRRLDRLDNEGLAATLMIVGLDRFKSINDTMGFEQGDDALRQAGQALRDEFRPTDLVARLRGDVFSIWLDGADQFAAAERAELLCQNGVTVKLNEDVVLRVSVGLTTRPAKSFESVDTLMDQAQAALSAIKLAGGGRWHFYNEEIGT